jgi:20S proteasome subunit alpha 6
MNRNNFDNDITTWSPEGNLYQIQYAMEAVKQGSATVGAKSQDFVVLTALKRSPTSELSSYQEKIFLIDSHVGMSVSGLISDARVLARLMRTETKQHRFLQENPMPIQRLMETVASESGLRTLQYGHRPFGVGLLVAGYDATHGTKLFQTCPSGNIYDFKAIAVGTRSQSARTYLERNIDAIATASKADLVHHALLALRETCPADVKLTAQNTSVAIVGKGQNFVVYKEDDVRDALALLPAPAAAPEPMDMD